MPLTFGMSMSSRTASNDPPHNSVSTSRESFTTTGSYSPVWTRKTMK